MSELINNSENRKKLLKHLILQLHEGTAPEQVRKQLMDLMQKIPYGEIVEVEQELINEGLPEAEVIKLCDIHGKVLEGNIDHTAAKEVPEGHPVDTFKKENIELSKVVDSLNNFLNEITADGKQITADSLVSSLNKIKGMFNALMDVDKHYQRKENLLFPFLEKKNITGPPKVMWAKHDETREKLKAAIEACNPEAIADNDDFQSAVEFLFKPAAEAVTDMIMKEDEILFPMAMDLLTDLEWYEIYQQTLEIGFCLYDPQVEWHPIGVEDELVHSKSDENLIQLPSGSFTPHELNALLNTLPFDLTFVDKDDKVRYFTQGEERIFARNRAILKRDVRLCHPPSSVHIVDQIINDFKTGKQDRAPFWINMHEQFIHIEYFAVRDENGEYLGTLEVSQNATGLRNLEGEQRLLSYSK
ncbi:MAG: DUF438 domain-containing protein [bacterium]